MKYVKSIFIWLVGLAISITSSMSLIYEFIDTLHRISDSDIPDTPVAYLAGGFFCAFLSVTFNIIIFLFFLVRFLTLKKNIEMRNLIYNKSESKFTKMIHILGYFLILIFIFNYGKVLITYHEFILSEFAYYTSSIVSIGFYIIILASIFDKKSLPTHTELKK